MPTLSVQESQAKIKDLLETNGGCELPCLWGIMHGKTIFSETIYHLDEFLISPEEFFNLHRSVVISLDGFSGFSYYYLDEGPFDGAYGSVYLLSREDIIVAIILDGYDELARKYSIQAVFQKYDRPNNIWIYTLRDSYGEGVLPYVMVLDYSNRGFLVYYKGNGYPLPLYKEGVVRMCYGEKSNPPKLILWDYRFENPIAKNDWEYVYSIWPEMKQLDVATGMNLSTFEELVNSGNIVDDELCLDTPSNLWDY